MHFCTHYYYWQVLVLLHLPPLFILYVAFSTNWRRFPLSSLLNNDMSLSQYIYVRFLSGVIAYYSIHNREYNLTNSQSAIEWPCPVASFPKPFMHRHSCMYISPSSLFLPSWLSFLNPSSTISSGMINFFSLIFSGLVTLFKAMSMVMLMAETALHTVEQIYNFQIWLPWRIL